MTEEKKIEDKVLLADQLHNAGFNCSQSALAALAPDLGLDQATALKISAAFGGGIARTGATCGAVTGALMAIGLKDGFATPDPAAKDRIYQLGRQFLARFKELHGSTLCCELLGCDLSTPEGMASAKDRDVFKTQCPRYIQDAVQIASEMLAD
jgi:C_GCAxxG_C_C family probable redox protein